jgi:MFS family permease
MSTRPAPFYGWVVLSAAFAIIALSIGTLFTLGVFVKPIEAGLGWSRASIGGIGLLNWLVMGVGGVVSGHLSDRFGTRIVVLGGGVVLGFGLVLSGQVREPWHLYAAFGVLVGAGVSAFYVPLTVLAVRWFDHQRGLAAAIVSAGNGLGILALAPLARWLIDGYDWRTAFVLLGDLAWLVVIPCALLLRPAPSPSAVSRPGEGPPAPEASLGRILLAWPIWAIALTHFACCAAHSGPLFHLVTHAMDQGIASMTAASIFGMSGLSSIVGRIGGGLLADRFGTKRTLIAMLAAQAAMIPIYTLATGEQALWGLSLAFGVTYGGVMPIYAVITREYFGDAVMGTAYGWVFFISCIGMGLGSFAGGVIYDALGSYQTLFLGSFAVGAMAAVLGFTLPRSRLVRTPRLA